MTGFRGTDEQLDREIAALERIARLRVKRVAAELREIDQDLRVLKRERARRAAQETGAAETAAPVAATP